MLPTEILAKIFRHTMDGSDGGLCIPPERSECPWKLRGICSRWRQIALQERRLWNNITIRMQQGKSADDFAYLGEIIPPQGPLLIALAPSRGYSDYSKDGLDVLDRVLYPHIHRTIRLKLDIDMATSSKFWTSPAGFLSPVEDVSFFIRGSLDRTGVSFDNIHDFTRSFENIQVFNCSRNLKRLSFRLANLYYKNSDHDSGDILLLIPYIPWTQLTHINLETFTSVETFYQILPQCHSVESFAITFENEGYYPDLTTPKYMDISPPISTSLLTTLRLRANFLPVSHYLPLKPIFPQLKFLELGGLDTRDHKATYALLESASLLEELTLTVTSFEPRSINTLPEPLVTLPYLRNWIISPKCDDQFSELLSPFVLPELKELHVDFSYSAQVPFPAEAVTHLIQRSGCSLLVFRCGVPISCSNDDQKILLTSFESLRECHMTSTILNADILKNIGQAEFLPEIRELITGVALPSLFIDAMENRMKHVPGTLLRKGWGIFRRPHGFTEDQFHQALQAASNRADELNRTFGTDFRVMGSDSKECMKLYKSYRLYV